ncbi:unnamed protein product [Fusarium equiseti]|uniref:Histone acetyltransferase n=1 Tax=Fusarium equiseti TaxID=61235 RepID=A0A8J2IUB3_FUSEQ|nr:unnamed protein product [Fusarium equiseti]
MGEEPQHSVMVSDEDAEYETAGETGGDTTIIATGSKGNGGTSSVDRNPSDDADLELSDRDASGEDVDASGEEDNDYMAPPQLSSHNSRQTDQEEGDEADEDAEGEEGAEREEAEAEEDHDEDVDAEGEEYEDDEGVGAVKFQPGTRDDDDEDSESDKSDFPSANEEESDEEAAWEDGAEAEEDHEDDETAASSNCIFCGQGEDDDPSEEFEAYLACVRCSSNDAAHQQCARDAAAMNTENVPVPEHWKCPECFSRESDVEEEDEEVEDQHVDHDVGLASQESDIHELSGGAHLEQQVEDEDASSHGESQHEDDEESDEEPREAPRTLRKRKSSSLEDDGTTISLRKRRRNQSNDAASEDTARNGSAEPGRNNPSRTLRLKVSRPPPVSIEKRTRTSLILRLNVKPGNLREILSRKRREKRRQPGTVTRPPPQRPIPTPRATAIAAISVLPTPFTSDSYSQPFYFDRDLEEMQGKPFGGILSEAEADTSKTLPAEDDEKRFKDALHQADQEWRARLLAMQEESNAPVRKAKKAADNASHIECIEFGGWEIDTWYAAPYPAEYCTTRVLYICEFCLKYMASDYVAWRHKLKCPAKHPPGDEIYRHGSVSVFEVDGRKNPVYCQNLCLLAKLFLGSKTLYYDVEPFLFYVLCEYNETGYHFVGYFSKEKRASSQNNVSCILTLPIHQRKGYGNLLIDFSYLLTKVEEKTGSPEKPLSDMGLVSYRNYWRLVMCRYFLTVMEGGKYAAEGLSIKRISDNTGMTPDDVISALEGLRALVRDPQTKTYAFRVDLDYCRQYVGKWEAKGYVQLKPEALVWTPYVMGRSNAVNFELGPPMNAIAPREDDEAKVDEGLGTTGIEVQSLLNGEKKDEPVPDTDVGTDAEPQSNVNGEAGDNAAESANADPAPVQSIEDVAPGQEKDKDVEMKDVEDDGPPAWLKPYQDIPYTRFEVFPAIPGGRRERTRPSVSRPTVPRTASSISRQKRSSNSHRSSSSRPKSSSKKKTGGTGRGPGRWPKGTKKSDYGNATSGPGLPPGWMDKQAKLRAITEGNDPEQEVAVEEPAEDSVVVSMRANGTKANGSAAARKASGDEEARGEQAAEGEDVDAEGEDV